EGVEGGGGVGLQGGLVGVEESRRPSYTAVKKAIAAAGTCAKPHGWKHASTVIGARGIWNLKPKPAVQTTFWSKVGTGEEATVQTGIFAADGGTPSAATLRSALDGGTSAALMQVGGLVKANSVRSFKFSRLPLATGRYVFAALLHATMNPARTKLLVSKPFTIR